MADIEKVINELVEHIESALDVDSDYVDCVRTDLLQTAVFLLKSQPEIVQCKDCKHWDIGHTEECENSDSVCFHNGWCKPDWFCADAEPKET